MQSRIGWHETDSVSIQVRRKSYGSDTARRVRGLPIDSVLISGSWITPSKQVRDLGVIIDSELTMIPHVNKFVSSCYFHICQLRAIRRSLIGADPSCTIAIWITRTVYSSSRVNLAAVASSQVLHCTSSQSSYEKARLMLSKCR